MRSGSQSPPKPARCSSETSVTSMTGDFIASSTLLFLKTILSTPGPVFQMDTSPSSILIAFDTLEIVQFSQGQYAVNMSRLLMWKLGHQCE